MIIHRAILTDGAERSAIQIEELRVLFESKSVTPDSLVQQEDGGKWSPLRAIVDLAEWERDAQRYSVICADGTEHLQAELGKILERTTAGDPMSALRWTNQSTPAKAAELTRQGHPVSDKTVARCLRKMGYSMQLNQKTREGPPHRDRDQQFRYLNRQVASFRKSGDPVLSVDTKKKELVGAFKNEGRTRRPKGDPERVNVHDFPSQAEGKAIPYGAYEIGDDRAVVNVGVTHDTAEFAVESIRRWWKLAGRKRKPGPNGF